jgi:hypothetical protein
MLGGIVRRSFIEFDINWSLIFGEDWMDFSQYIYVESEGNREYYHFIINF